MDMSLREWLAVIGGVLLFIIVADGYRRMLRAKRDHLEVSRNMGGSLGDDSVDDYNPELPNGGARVVRRETREAIDPRNEHTDTGHFQADHDVQALNADRDEPDFDADEDTLVAEPKRPAQSSANRPRFPEAVKVADVAETPTAQPVRQKSTQSAPVAEQTSNPSRVQSMAAAARSMLKKDRPEPARNAAPAEKKPQEIIVVNVLSKDEEGFDGSRLRRLVEACGMEPDQMSVFVRHEHGFGTGPVQFGMANLMDPGTFNLDTLDSESIFGVCFYLTLPGPDDSMKAFEYMLETAQCVVRNLNGELKDERRSVFTQQTIEHCRQRIREFERRQQLAARV